MPYLGVLSEFLEFQQYLVGTWRNENFGGPPRGGPDDPFSYNIMPLPQDSTPSGYILKNFRFFEKIVFHDARADVTVPVAAKAPNRGGNVTQNARAIFYDQQVRFTEPAAHKGSVVHVENGAWLSLDKVQQQDGPFPPGTEIEAEPGEQQPSDIRIAKQIAVPHGNSILALGGYDTFEGSAIIQGRPVIPDGPLPYPKPYVENSSCAHEAVPEISVLPYSNMDPEQNPHPDLTLHPNAPLQQAVEHIGPSRYLHWRVTTEPLVHGQGVVTNIPFEERRANVSGYHADYWLLSNSTSPVTHKPLFNYLAYTQTMFMDMFVHGHRYTFPHVTCNVVRRA